MLLEAAASQIDQLRIVGTSLEDVSSSGTKATLVLNKGVASRAFIDNVNGSALESVWRQAIGSSAATTLALSNVDVDATYCMVNDVAIATTKLSNVRVRTGTVFHSGAAGTFRVDAVGCQFDARFIRNAAGAATWTVSAQACSAGTPLQVDAGSPTIRIGAGGWCMSLDGTLLDATATNHAVGSGFFNSNAAFGAGVGAYVRGSATWARVAA